MRVVLSHLQWWRFWKKKQKTKHLRHFDLTKESGNELHAGHFTQPELFSQRIHLSTEKHTYAQVRVNIDVSFELRAATRNTALYTYRIHIAVMEKHCRCVLCVFCFRGFFVHLKFKKVLSNIHKMHCDLFTFSKRKKKQTKQQPPPSPPAHSPPPNCGHVCVHMCGKGLSLESQTSSWKGTTPYFTSCSGLHTSLMLQASKMFFEGVKLVSYAWKVSACTV